MSTTQPESGASGGPTVLRMLLGAQLRRLREANGISREAAGWEIRASESKISRMELGRVGFKERDVADLLALYGVEDEDERAALLALTQEANLPGWWQRFGDVLPPWFQAYVGLEASATLIRTYQLQFVPGLLQTEDYARAVIALGHGLASEEEIERRVALRMTRQQLLSTPGAPRLWAVVDEAALRRPIGGTEVMRRQLQTLIEAAKRPNIRLQVIPFGSGGHAAEGGAFTILRFPDQDLPDVVYVEQLTSALYLEKREDVDQYGAAMERLFADAEPPDRTVEILERILHDLSRHTSIDLVQAVRDLGGDLSDRHIARLCTDRRDNPTLQTVEELAAALEVSPAAFVGGRKSRRGDEQPRRSFSAKLRHLFETVYPPGRGPYLPAEVARAISAGDHKYGPISAADIEDLLDPPADALPNPRLKHVLGLAEYFGLAEDDGPRAAYFLDDELAATVDAELADLLALRNAGVAQLAAMMAGQAPDWDSEMRRHAVRAFTQASESDEADWVFLPRRDVLG